MLKHDVNKHETEREARKRPEVVPLAAFLSFLQAVSVLQEFCRNPVYYHTNLSQLVLMQNWNISSYHALLSPLEKWSLGLGVSLLLSSLCFRRQAGTDTGVWALGAAAAWDPQARVTDRDTAHSQAFGAQELPSTRPAPALPFPAVRGDTSAQGPPHSPGPPTQLYLLAETCREHFFRLRGGSNRFLNIYLVSWGKVCLNRSI